MDLKLKGKNAIVTGSSNGIGFSIAKNLHQEGCNVTLNGRTSKSLENALLHFNDRIHSCKADVTNSDDSKKLINNAIDHWGSIDILVCNVGNGSSVLPGNENHNEWQKTFQENFFSATNVIESTLNAKTTLTSIVCISSIAGIESIGAPVTYSVAKAGINAYVKNMSRYLAKSGIRINAIAPGNILSETSVWKKKLDDDPKIIKKMLEKEVPMNRFGIPEEISSLAAFLCSEKSSFITGSIFVADGGQIHS